MTHYYVEPELYPAYAATPTWNAAQDGDGKATDLSTPAVASILLNAQPSAGNLLSICGISIGATSGGTLNYTIGGSVSATADNIATLLNSSSATTQVSANVATGQPQLRDLIYARGPSTGAAANTVEIMTRVGSADFNNSTNPTYWTLAQTGWGTAPTFTQWAGGTSGAWGYLLNMSSIWPSAVAAGGYGVWKSGARAQPHHGPATLSIHDDTVFCRCNGVTLTTPSNPNYTINRGGLSMVYDDGSGEVAAWSGDTGTMTIKIVIVGANSAYIAPAGAISVAFRSKAFGRFVFEVATGAGIGTLSKLFAADTTGGESLFDGIKVVFTETSASSNQYAWSIINGGKLTTRNCKVYYALNLIPYWYSTNSSSNNDLLVENCDIVYSGSPPSPVNALMQVYASCNESRFVFRNVRNIGLPAAQKLFSFSPGASSSVVMIGDSCEGFDVPATLVGYSAASRTQHVDKTFMQLYNMGANRGITYETPQGYIQWWSGEDYPTYSALLPNENAWSLRYRWLSHTTNGISVGRPFTLWRGSQTVVSSGNTVLTMELLLDPATASSVSKGHFALSASYISDATSGLKYASSLEMTTQNALASSVAGWSMGSTYNGYTKAKLVCTLPDAIKLNTEIEFALQAIRPAPSADQYVFFDPVVSLS